MSHEVNVDADIIAAAACLRAVLSLSKASPSVTTRMAPASAVMLSKRAAKGVRAAGFAEGGAPLNASLRNSTGASPVAVAVRLALSADEAENARMRERSPDPQAIKALEPLPNSTN